MKKTKSDGIILVEILFALVILTGGSMVVFQSYRASLRMVRESGVHYEKALALESRMGELELTGRAEEAYALIQ